MNRTVAIVSDAWTPQVNGVVQTLKQIKQALTRMGHHVVTLTPDQHHTFPCPTYPEIRLAIKPGKHIARQLDELKPDHIHIATEGTLGLAARRYCKKNGLAFTTSYHTQFPEYVRKRIPVPLSLLYRLVRWFHGGATQTMVAAPSQEAALRNHGFNNLVRWSRGVDTELFNPHDALSLDLPAPVFVYMGRVAVEKNIEAFLSLDLPGTKCVIGDGPALEILEDEYPDTVFFGYKFGKDLARHLAGADVFVFPSRTDTFGLVLLEAMACGLPVAAYPVTGPKDIIKDGKTGVLNEDLRTAALAALELNGQHARREALTYSWEASAQQFLDNLVDARGPGKTGVELKPTQS